MSRRKKRASPSFITGVLSCPRQYAYKKKYGEPYDPNEGKSKGTVIHNRLELHFKGGTLDISDELGKRAMKALDVLPSRHRPGLHPEHVFEMEVDGVPWWCKSDLVDTREAVVHDYKSTKSTEYMLDEELLQQDVQFAVYGYGYLTDFDPNAAVINGQWTYILTEGKRQALPVRVTATRETVLENFRIVNQIAKILLELPTDPDVLPRHYDHCSSFGGCKHRARCQPKPGPDVLASSLFRPRKEVKHMSLLEMLDAAEGIAAEVADAPAPPLVTAGPEELLDPAPSENLTPTGNIIDTTVVEGEKKDQVEPGPEPARGRGRPKGSRNKKPEETVPAKDLPEVPTVIQGHVETDTYRTAVAVNKACIIQAWMASSRSFGDLEDALELYSRSTERR